MLPRGGLVLAKTIAIKLMYTTEPMARSCSKSVILVAKKGKARFHGIIR
jgi:hypothetical protein